MQKVRIQLSALPVYHNGRSALMIRKIFVNRDIIKFLVAEILKKGVFDFEGEVIFMNKINAIKSLKEKGLI